jgi:hypothetical protein
MSKVFKAWYIVSQLLWIIFRVFYVFNWITIYRHSLSNLFRLIMTQNRSRSSRSNDSRWSSIFTFLQSLIETWWIGPLSIMMTTLFFLIYSIFLFIWLLDSFMFSLSSFNRFRLCCWTNAVILCILLQVLLFKLHRVFIILYQIMLWNPYYSMLGFARLHRGLSLVYWSGIDACIVISFRFRTIRFILIILFRFSVISRLPF